MPGDLLRVAHPEGRAPRGARASIGRASALLARRSARRAGKALLSGVTSTLSVSAARARSVPKTRATRRANSYFMELYWKIRSSLYAHLLRYKLIQKDICVVW